MPPAASKPATQRKRTMKWKRRAASISSSSSPSSDSSDEETIPAKVAPKVQTIAQSSSSDSDSESSESSSEGEEEDETSVAPKTSVASAEGKGAAVAPRMREISRSPSPISAELPTFLPADASTQESETKEQEMKDGFRRFWMVTIADVQVQMMLQARFPY